MIRLNICRTIAAVVVIFPVFSSCSGDGKYIHYDEPLEIVLKKAARAKKSLCLLLTDDHTGAGTYIEAVEDREENLNTVFNVVDMGIPRNEWYRKWLCPVEYPVACVFRDGELISLISGFSYESVKDLRHTLKNPRQQSKIYFPNRFGLEPENIVTAMGAVLKCKLMLDRNEDTIPMTDSTVRSLDYPFGAYLNIRNEERLGRPVAALCREFRKFKTLYNLQTYKEEFLYIERCLNPGCDASAIPKLAVVSDSFPADSCAFENEYGFEVCIRNEGELPLSVLRVMSSCGCLRFEGYSNFSLKPGDEISLPFIFKPDSKGDIFREISILSDDPENPLTNITIRTRAY